MKVLLLTIIICASQIVPGRFDDSGETTATQAAGDESSTQGPVDFDQFDSDLKDIYKSIAKIKSKATKLEVIGPKIQNAMLHLEGDEEQVAKDLQAKYEQLVPFLQKLPDTGDQQKAEQAARKRRDVSNVTDATTSIVISSNIPSDYSVDGENATNTINFGTTN